MASEAAGAKLRPSAVASIDRSCFCQKLLGLLPLQAGFLRLGV